MERVGWIDFLRGISMIAIFVFHTEVYYKEYNASPYYLYTTNAIILFYFLSGYLFYREYGFDMRRKVVSIFRSMMIPYFVFTTLIALPKAIIRHSDIHWQDVLINIITGRASWFIVALIVAEIAFSALLVVSRGKNGWLLLISTVCFMAYYVVPFNQHNYWQWQDALLTLPFLCIGFLYHKYEKHYVLQSKTSYLAGLSMILIGIKLYELRLDLPMRNIAIENIPLFLADSIIWLLLVVSIIKYIPHFRLIEWTGQHCIIYYFLCGGCPLLISTLLNRIGLTYDGYFYCFLIAFIFSYTLATALTAGIYKYVPFIIGKNAGA